MLHSQGKMSANSEVEVKKWYTGAKKVASAPSYRFRWLKSGHVCYEV